MHTFARRAGLASSALFLRSLGKLARPLPGQPPLPFFIQRCEGCPVVTGDKQDQERDREEIVGIDRKRDHRGEIGPYRDLDKWQPAAAAAVFGDRQLRLFLSDRVFRSARKLGLIPEQRLENGSRVNKRQRDARGNQRGQEGEGPLPRLRKKLAVGDDIKRRDRPE